MGQTVPLREVVAARPKDRVVGEGLGPSSGQDRAGEAGVGCRLRCPQPQRRRGRRPRPRLVANGRHAGGACPRHHRCSFSTEYLLFLFAPKEEASPLSTRRLSSFCAPRCDIPSKSATSELLTDSIPSMCESAFRSDAERLSELFPPLSELLAWLSELLGGSTGHFIARIS